MRFEPRPTPDKRHEESSINKRTVLLAIVLVVGVFSIGALISEGYISISSLNLPSFGAPPTPPPIALYPPGDDTRENLKNRLIDEGYEEEEIGIIRDINEEKMAPEGDEDYLYRKDNIPIKIPLSGDVVINNLEIFDGNKIKFEVENTASHETNTPFYKLNARMIIEHPRTGEPTITALYRIASVEVGEEGMAPGEKREVATDDLCKVLEEVDFVCIGIDSVWVELEDFKSWRR